MVGIVDEAVSKNGGIDNLKISPYKNALVEFIKKTRTPITIGIQGDWGSGKTSLLNQIWNDLDPVNEDNNEDNNIYQIWVNSWEHSLLCTPEESLIKIVNEIIKELLKADQSKSTSEKISRGVSNLMKGAVRLTGQVVGGSAGTDFVDDLLGENVNSIKELRESLQLLVSEIKSLPSNPYSRVVVYVDDLDRIKPEDAVAILELLKNIFNIKDCIFILAIDYKVVVKGLEKKFDKRTDANEWEFRAFFDKIIQLPFSMPLSNYDIGNYVSSLLQEIDYYDGDFDSREHAEETNQKIEAFVKNTIGGNPRSIKRLINSLSLIKHLSSNDEVGNSNGMSDDEALILFAMVCLEVAYSEFYQLLVDEPDFLNWNEATAQTITQKKEVTKDNWDHHSKVAFETSGFDEPWEQCIYRICFASERLKPSAAKISNFFNLLRSEKKEIDSKQSISKSGMNLDFNTIFENALSKSAVTSVTVKDKVNTRPAKGSFKPYIVSGLEAWVEERAKKDHNNTRYADFPSAESLDYIKHFVEYLETKYNAVNWETGTKEKFSIKYASSLALYIDGKKVMNIRIFPKPTGEFIWFQSLKRPSDGYAFLQFQDHKFKELKPLPQVLSEPDEDNKMFQGNFWMQEWQSMEMPIDHSMNIKSLIEYLIEYNIDIYENEMDDVYSSSVWEKNYLKDFVPSKQGTSEYESAKNKITDVFKNNIEGKYKLIEV